MRCEVYPSNGPLTSSHPPNNRTCSFAGRNRYIFVYCEPKHREEKGEANGEQATHSGGAKRELRRNARVSFRCFFCAPFASARHRHRYGRTPADPRERLTRHVSVPPVPHQRREQERAAHDRNRKLWETVTWSQSFDVVFGVMTLALHF